MSGFMYHSFFCDDYERGAKKVVRRYLAAGYGIEVGEGKALERTRSSSKPSRAAAFRDAFRGPQETRPERIIVPRSRPRVRLRQRRRRCCSKGHFSAST